LVHTQSTAFYIWASHIDTKRLSQTKLVHTQSTAFRHLKHKRFIHQQNNYHHVYFSFPNLVYNTNQTYILSTQQYSLCHQGENEQNNKLQQHNRGGKKNDQLLILSLIPKLQKLLIQQLIFIKLTMIHNTIVMKTTILLTTIAKRGTCTIFMKTHFGTTQQHF